MKTDDEIRRLAGHPDAISSAYIEYFLKRWRECEAQGGEPAIDHFLKEWRRNQIL